MLLGTPLVFIGNSGCGKDTTISLLTDHIYSRGYNIKVIKRYITRPPDKSESNHFVPIEKFNSLSSENFFELQWVAYDNHYGYSKMDIDLSLKSTDFVILNVSRTVINEVISKFPNSIIVNVTCNDELAKSRIKSRSRDNFISERISRFNSLQHFPENTITITNNDTIDKLKTSLFHSFNEILRNSLQQSDPSILQSEAIIDTSMQYETSCS
jgi:phosphonate metabolism protein PhnN/1,5-bisphosphokinase (PRPP-forming)